MKKLILTVAILAGSMSTFAMSNTVIPTEGIEIVMNETFTEITLDKLPAAVVNAAEKDFPGVTISKAYVNANEQYKLVISMEGTESTVYADKDGNWLEAEATKQDSEGNK